MGRIDRTGSRFGRLIVKRFVGKASNWVGIWECVCDCGKTITALSSNLTSGNTKSCGCLKLGMLNKRSTKHGLSGGAERPTRLYKIWIHMRGRCFNKRNRDYKFYGQRGITVCKEWNDYKLFFDWSMANGYNSVLTIERIENNGNYEPGNCRWATRKEQARNTRASRFVTFGGETKTVAEWADVLNIPYSVLRMRFHRGWPADKALTQPIRN